MESRRLVVWITAGILGFQGATLAFDLLNCTVLSWLFVRQHGLGVELVKPGGGPGAVAPAGGATGGRSGPPGPAVEQGAVGAVESGGDGSGSASSSPAAGVPEAPLQPRQEPQNPPAVVGAFDPTGVFCAQPRSRIDDAVSQGLTILAGLALGSSVGGGGKGADGGP
ncbi:MAG: hypothetical protein ACK55X_13410 [Synechococcaceae cyanobacterium]